MGQSDRRRSLKTLAAWGLLGGVGLTGLIRDVLAKEGSAVPKGVIDVEGPVKINGRLARPGMTVGTGDTVVTGAGAKIVYVIGQDAFLQRENSTVSFSGVTTRVMRVLTGKILSVFGKGRKKLETATAVIGIRGTGCYIESEPRRVYFCLCYGVAELTPRIDPTRTERIQTRHHDHPVYIYADNAMPMMVDASVDNHSDAELELLESLVDRKPPFSDGLSRRY